MSYIKCESCHNDIILYPDDSKKNLCDLMGIKYLLSFPFDPQVSRMASLGLPYMKNPPSLDSTTSIKYLELTNTIINLGDEKNESINK